MSNNMEIQKQLEAVGFFDVRQITDAPLAFEFFYRSDALKVKGFIAFPENIENSSAELVMVNRGGTGEFAAVDEDKIKKYGFLNRAGYITAFSQYRGVSGGDGIDRMGGDDVFDVINLYDLVKLLPYVQGNKAFLWGGSRGGMMAMQVLMRVGWVRAIVLVNPLADEFDTAVYRPAWRAHQLETYGGSEIEMMKRSPVLWPELKEVPAFFYIGLKDKSVNPARGIALAKRMNAELVTKEDEGHLASTAVEEPAIEFLRKVK